MNRATTRCLWLIAVVLVTVSAGVARAAGTAFGTDTAEVSEPGNCKIESWLSWASNQDFIAVANPSCVVNLGRAVEVSTQIQRSRSDGEWDTFVAPKFKTNIIPSAIGRWGVAVAGGTVFNVTTNENVGFFAYVPATMRFNDVVRLNLNAGWQWDRIADHHFFTYGAGVDWRTPDNVWTLTAEVFGLLGTADTRTQTDPRFQVGLRWRPIDRFSLDFIYGRNITGENANWITIATSIRFPGGSGKSAGE